MCLHELLRLPYKKGGRANGARTSASNRGVYTTVQMQLADSKAHLLNCVLLDVEGDGVPPMVKHLLNPAHNPTTEPVCVQACMTQAACNSWAYLGHATA
jgi:hypothetical protein